jgi:hypothetical protein
MNATAASGVTVESSCLRALTALMPAGAVGKLLRRRTGPEEQHPVQLDAGAEPELLRRLAEELNSEQANAGTPPDAEPVELARQLYTHPAATPDLRHRLAQGPLGPALARRLLDGKAAVSDLWLRPLLATGDPDTALRVLHLDGYRTTDGEQARAALLVSAAGRTAELSAAANSLRRAVRQALRHPDRAAATLRRLAERQEGTAGLVRLLAERPHAAWTVLHIPHRPGALAPDALLQLHRDRPLPLPVRLALIRYWPCPPELARGFLDHSGRRDGADARWTASAMLRITAPVLAASPARAEEVRRLSHEMAGAGLATAAELVEQTAPVRLLAQLVVPHRETAAHDDHWQPALYEQQAAALRRLLAEVTPSGLRRVLRAAPRFPGPLPELLREAAGRDDADRDAELDIGVKNLTHLLLHHAPTDALDAAVRRMSEDTALELAKVSTAWLSSGCGRPGGDAWQNRFHRAGRYGVLDAVAAKHPEAHPRLLDSVLAAPAAEVLRRDIWILPALIEHEVPGATRHALRNADRITLPALHEVDADHLTDEILDLSDTAHLPLPAATVLAGDERLGTEARRRALRVMACQLPPARWSVALAAWSALGRVEAVRLAAEDTALPSRARAAARHELTAGIGPETGPITLTDLLQPQPPLVLESQPIPWDEITAHYRASGTLPRAALDRVLDRDDLPPGLAALLLDAHGRMLRQPAAWWRRPVIEAALPRLREMGVTGPQWLREVLRLGTVDERTVIRLAAPARLVLPVLAERALESKAPSARPAGALAGWGAEPGPDSPAGWVVALRLLPDFPGTLAELLATASGTVQHPEPGNPPEAAPG